MEDSCEYIEYAVVDSRKWVFLNLGGWARGKLLTVKTSCYEMFHRISDLYRLLGMTYLVLTLREGYRLRVYKNRVLRKAFGP
jgi:hypothetical protein